MVHFRNEPWVMPDYSRLLLAYDLENSVNNTSGNKKRFSSRYLVPPRLLPEGKRYTLVASALFSREFLLGTVLFELGMKDKSIYAFLNYQVGSALRSSLLFTERKKSEKKLVRVLKELEISNRKLTVLSERDEMTGLYNRRGFLQIAEQNLNLVRRMRKDGILMFADLDGLKKINDTYGHNEGDIAIRETSNILLGIFRETDIVGRMGGDEFVVFAMDVNPDCFERIKERLYWKIKEYNAASSKSYELSISTGTTIFDFNTGETVEELMIKADQALYKNKKNKKKTAP